MASYHFAVAAVSRSKGQSVVASAAYRAGERLEDERTGQTFDYTRRSGVLHAEIIAPDNTPDWMRDRAQLWNAVEAVEMRRDAQLARHIELALPHELTHAQRLTLVREFVRDEFTSKGMIADIAFHAPDRHGDQRNYHAHILLTMRTLTGDGFGNKARAWNSTGQLEQWREEWADHTNRMFEREGIDAHVDHRSLAAQGIDQEPQIHLGWAAAEIVRRGQATDRGDELSGIRERNEERAKLVKELQEIEAQLTAEKAQTAEREPATAAPEQSAQPVPEQSAQPAPAPERPLGKTAGEIRMAWSLTDSGAGFVAALEDRGLTPAVVSAEEARASERAHAFAKELDRYAAKLNEGELVVLDARGNVHRIDQRTTGAQRAEIDKHLATVDRDALMTVTDARAALQDMRREQFIAGQQAARPYTAIETRILDAHRASPNGEEFAAQLDKAGLSLATATAEDVKHLATERAVEFAAYV